MALGRMFSNDGMLVIALLLLLISIESSESADSKPKLYELEAQLYKDIVKNEKYQPQFRPTDTTIINFSVSLASIVEVNEKSGYITTTFIPKMSWSDPRLTWNATGKYAAVSHLQVPSKDIWLPDLEVLNRHIDTTHDNAMQPLLWLHSDGTVYYVPRQTYQTPCQFDLDEFPFDVQTCQVVLGSWAYLKSEVDFRKVKNGTDESFYVGHSEFLLNNLTMERLDTYYGDGSIPFVELVVNVTLIRKSSYFYYMYILPADIFLFMIPIIHLLPANRDSKLTLLGSLMICTVLMMNLLSDFMPGYYADRPPKALRVYFSCVVSIFVSALVSCITFSISNTDTKTRRVPLALQKTLLTGLGRLCCICPEADRVDYQLLNLEKSLEEVVADEVPGTTNDDRELLPQGETEEPKINNVTPESKSAVVKALHLLVGELQLARYRDRLRMEWIQLAQVIDALACVLLLISAFCMTRLNHFHYHNNSQYEYTHNYYNM